MNRINREYIEEYLEELANYPHSPVMEEMVAEARKEGLPILREPVACFLRVLVQSSGAQKALEVGTSIGYSTMVLLDSMGKEGKVVTIEVDEVVQAKAREYFKKAGVSDRVTMFLGDAGEIIPFMDGEFDLIFLDGPKAQYLNYLSDCIRLLKTGGLLLCDDVLFYGMIASDGLVQRRKITIVKRMRKFLEAISTHPQLVTSVIPLGDGLSVSIKK